MKNNNDSNLPEWASYEFLLNYAETFTLYNIPDKCTKLGLAGLSPPPAASSSAPLCSEASFDVLTRMNAHPVEVSRRFFHRFQPRLCRAANKEKEMKNPGLPVSCCFIRVKTAALECGGVKWQRQREQREGYRNLLTSISLGNTG